MTVDYIHGALSGAHFEIIEDQKPFYGEVRELPGVYATGSTLEKCRVNLRDMIEGWIILSLKRNLPTPEIG